MLQIPSWLFRTSVQGMCTMRHKATFQYPQGNSYGRMEELIMQSSECKCESWGFDSRKYSLTTAAILLGPHQTLCDNASWNLCC